MTIPWYPALRPLIHQLNPEVAHRAGIEALRMGLLPAPKLTDDPRLSTTVGSLTFPNPVGLAAGFDKNAEVPVAVLRHGFGFTEVGTVTPRPQPGNPKPRLFRLREDEAVINRLGFNNEGLSVVRERLQAARTARREQKVRGLIGGNVGKNRTTDSAVGDFQQGAVTLAPFVDYLVLNVSSPNTPGLRALQQVEELRALLEGVSSALREASGPYRPPVWLKLAPDLDSSQFADVVDVAVTFQVEALVMGNTTIDRSMPLKSPHREQSGGLSGRPLGQLATEKLRALYRVAAGRLPLVGVGGIHDAPSLYARLRAGAAAVQVYTVLIYEGIGWARTVLRELSSLLERDGLGSVSEAVGRDA